MRIYFKRKILPEIEKKLMDGLYNYIEISGKKIEVPGPGLEDRKIRQCISSEKKRHRHVAALAKAIRQTNLYPNQYYMEIGKILSSIDLGTSKYLGMSGSQLKEEMDKAVNESKKFFIYYKPKNEQINKKISELELSNKEFESLQEIFNSRIFELQKYYDAKSIELAENKFVPIDQTYQLRIDTNLINEIEKYSNNYLCLIYANKLQNEIQRERLLLKFKRLAEKQIEKIQNYKDGTISSLNKKLDEIKITVPDIKKIDLKEKSDKELIIETLKEAEALFENEDYFEATKKFIEIYNELGDETPVIIFDRLIDLYIFDMGAQTNSDNIFKSYTQAAQFALLAQTNKSKLDSEALEITANPEESKKKTLERIKSRGSSELERYSKYLAKTLINRAINNYYKAKINYHLNDKQTKQIKAQLFKLISSKLIDKIIFFLGDNKFFTQKMSAALSKKDAKNFILQNSSINLLETVTQQYLDRIYNENIKLLNNGADTSAIIRVSKRLVDKIIFMWKNQLKDSKEEKFRFKPSKNFIKRIQQDERQKVKREIFEKEVSKYFVNRFQAAASIYQGFANLKENQLDKTLEDVTSFTEKIRPLTSALGVSTLFGATETAVNMYKRNREASARSGPKVLFEMFTNQNEIEFFAKFFAKSLVFANYNIISRIDSSGINEFAKFTCDRVVNFLETLKNENFEHDPENLLSKCFEGLKKGSIDIEFHQNNKVKYVAEKVQFITYQELLEKYFEKPTQEEIKNMANRYKVLCEPGIVSPRHIGV